MSISACLTSRGYLCPYLYLCISLFHHRFRHLCRLCSSYTALGPVSLRISPCIVPVCAAASFAIAVVCLPSFFGPYSTSSVVPSPSSFYPLLQPGALIARCCSRSTLFISPVRGAKANRKALVANGPQREKKTGEGESST